MSTYAVIEDGEITSIYTGSEPPSGAVRIPEGLNPFRIEWDEGKIVERPAGVDDEARAAMVRVERDQKLWASDWTQLPDAPLTDAQKAAYGTYRQALRDLTDHVNFPNLEADDWPQVEEQ